MKDEPMTDPLEHRTEKEKAKAKKDPPHPRDTNPLGPPPTKAEDPRTATILYPGGVRLDYIDGRYLAVPAGTEVEVRRREDLAPDNGDERRIITSENTKKNYVVVVAQEDLRAIIHFPADEKKALPQELGP